MARRNHRGGIAQTPKPKGGRIRKASFWHSIASGIQPADVATIKSVTR